MNRWDEFDCALVGDLTELPPPPEELSSITPWKEAMERIVTGLCLTCFTLNFAWLQYILPAIGTMQLYLGFRALRQTNRWFRYAWIISGCKGIFLYIHLLLLATPVPPLPTAVLLLFGTLPTLLLLICFRQGLRQITRENRSVKNADPALWAILWHMGLIALAVFFPQPGWPVFLILIFLFVRIIKALLAAAAGLETAGYTLRAAPVRVSSGRLRLSVFGSLLALLLALTVLSHYAPLSGSALPADTPETEELRSEITALGLPEDLSEHLLPEDLARLSGAIRCEADGYQNYGTDADNALRNRIYFFPTESGDVQVLHFFGFEDSDGYWENRSRIESNAGIHDAVLRLFYTGGDGPRLSSLFALPTEVESGIDFFGQPYTAFHARFPAFAFPLGARDKQAYLLYTAGQRDNPATSLKYMLSWQSDPLPEFPYRAGFGKADWSCARAAYYGNGSGLMWKADEATE